MRGELALKIIESLGFNLMKACLVFGFVCLLLLFLTFFWRLTEVLF